MKHSTRFLSLAALATGLTLTVAAQTPPAIAPGIAKPDPANVRAFIELTRSDLKTQKLVLIAENLPLTADEAAEFWPVQREYEAELSKIGDDKLALIIKYANQYETMTDAEAAALAEAALVVEEKRVALKRKYFKKFSEVIPAKKATRYFQVENQFVLLIDLQIAASLPLIK
jgi:hypothetical protein